MEFDVEGQLVSPHVETGSPFSVVAAALYQGNAIASAFFVITDSSGQTVGQGVGTGPPLYQLVRLVIAPEVTRATDLELTATAFEFGTIIGQKSLTVEVTPRNLTLADLPALISSGWEGAVTAIAAVGAVLVPIALAARSDPRGVVYIVRETRHRRSTLAAPEQADANGNRLPESAGLIAWNASNHFFPADKGKLSGDVVIRGVPARPAIRVKPVNIPVELSTFHHAYSNDAARNFLRTRVWPPKSGVLVISASPLDQVAELGLDGWVGGVRVREISPMRNIARWGFTLGFPIAAFLIDASIVRTWFPLIPVGTPSALAVLALIVAVAAAGVGVPFFVLTRYSTIPRHALRSLEQDLAASRDPNG